MEQFPVAVVVENYVPADVEREQSLIQGFCTALLEIEAFRREAALVLGRFPWLREKTAHLDDMHDHILGKAATPQEWMDWDNDRVVPWPSDWRGCVSAVKQLAERYGLGGWQSGLVATGEAIGASGSDGRAHVFAFALPEAKRIQLVLDVTYYTWGWDTLQREVVKAVRDAARKQYTTSNGGRKRRPSAIMTNRDIRLYLWRVQGMNDMETKDAWSKWYKEALKRAEESWRASGLSVQKREELRAEWGKAARLTSATMKVATHRMRQTLNGEG